MSNLNEDLIDVSNLFNKLFYPFKLLLKYLKISVLFVSLFLFISVGLFFIVPRKYESTFIIKSNEYADKYFINMVVDIESLAKDKDVDGLMSNLKVTKEVAQEISSVKFLAINKSSGSDSSTALIVTPVMTSIENFHVFEKAVLDYLNESEHYKEVKAQRFKFLDSLIKKSQQEIEEIDSIKKIVVNNISPNGDYKGAQLVYNVPIDPYKGYDISYYRYKDQLGLRSKLQKQKSFENIKPCVVSKKPIAPKLSYFVLAGFILGVIVCLIYLLAKKI